MISRKLSIAWPAILFIAVCLPKNAFAVELTYTVGNKDLHASSYAKWPGIMALINRKTRVYQFDVNGHEQFFYKGGIDELNSALKDFSKLDLKRHRVYLLPGKGEMETPIEKLEIAFVWKMQIVEGIVKATILRHPDAQLVWPAEPAIYIFVDNGRIRLDEIQVPVGLEIESVDKLIENHRKAIDECHDQVRGSAIHNLGQIVPFESNAMEIVMNQLNSDNEWAAINASSTIAEFGSMAHKHLDELQELAENHDSDRVKKNLVKSIGKIRNADPTDPREIESFRVLVKQLNAFAEMPRYNDE